MIRAFGMTDPFAALAPLRRPKLLIRAARAGLALYQPERDLRRVLRRIGTGAVVLPGTVLDALLAAEDRLETCRRAGDAAYRATAHVEVMTALLAEAERAPGP